MEKIILLLAFVAMYVTEAFHDYYVILNSNGNAIYDRKWHIADFIFHVILASLIGYITKEWLYVPIIALIRWAVFQNGLNILRGKSFFYLGANGIDGMLSKIFGKAAGVILFLFSLTGLGVLIYFLFR